MKKKLFRRIAALTSTVIVGAAALAMFAGCTTKHPQITITYEFNGKTYEVDYTLSRNDAPKTVQHFIELADAGFYDGLVVHDFSSSKICSGGYTLAEGGDVGDNYGLTEINYFERVKQLEQEKDITFTQSVWYDEARTQPTYTVYGEFVGNGAYTQYQRENSYTKGALVMDYTQKGGNNPVWVERADGGKGNDGEAYQQAKYTLNSATSLFYTFTGESGTSSVASNYCVFGMAKDYSQIQELLDAITEYEDTLQEGSFTETVEDYLLNQYDTHFELGDYTTDFSLAVDKPIKIKSVEVTKY